MSLLLDALKKAEKAKEDARRNTQAAGAEEPDEATPHVRTRNELPDISRAVEISPGDTERTVVMSSSAVPDAFSTAPRPMKEPPPPSLTPEQGAAPRPRPSTPSPDPLSESQAQQASAKKVFEAKFREPNPKLPFYITMAVLGMFSVGTVVYFWYQLRPPPPLVNSNPKPSTDEKRADLPRVAVQPPPPQSSAAPPIPGLPQNPAPAPVVSATPPIGTAVAPSIPPNPQAATAPAARQSGPAPNAAAPAMRERPRAESRTSPAAQRQSPPAPAAGRAAPDSSRLSVNRAAPAVDPKLDAAWQAYNQGDLRTARSNYQTMLREDPANRDALLGMAAVEIRSNRPEQAASYYQSLVQANPRDTHAQAGLIALRSQMGDPVQTESRVKNLLASDPDAQILYFTLGNQYSQQGRWAEAQQAYFKAHAADPENPDFAYNLAVSLDQVRQPKLALEYYRKALTLAQQRAASFDQALARNRVQELSR